MLTNSKYDFNNAFVNAEININKFYHNILYKIIFYYIFYLCQKQDGIYIHVVINITLNKTPKFSRYDSG